MSIAAARRLAPLIITLALPALGSAGAVVKIDQRRAQAGRITPGDRPGFPVSITKAGEYRLTSDLLLVNLDGNQHIDGFSIEADDVVIDLGGFGIFAGTNCSARSRQVHCAPIGAGSGVHARGRRKVVVRNGTVRGFANRGVVLGDAARVEHVNVSSNAAEGIVVGAGSLVSECQASFNGRDGIQARGASVIRGNQVFRNGGDGIESEPGSLVQENRAELNGGFGLRLSGDGRYSGNILTGNHNGPVEGGDALGRNLCDFDRACP